jgi:hypothetical protein
MVGIIHKLHAVCHRFISIRLEAVTRSIVSRLVVDTATRASAVILALNIKGNFLVLDHENYFSEQ